MVVIKKLISFLGTVEKKNKFIENREENIRINVNQKSKNLILFQRVFGPRMEREIALK